MTRRRRMKADGAWSGASDEAADVDDDDDDDDVAVVSALSDAGRHDASDTGPGGVANVERNHAPFVYRMTLDQLHAFSRLHDRLAAYGNLLSGVERKDLADDTLTALGHAIFEAVQCARVLMDKVAEPAVSADPAGARRVREAQAFYRSPSTVGRAVNAALPRRPAPVSNVYPQAATRH